VLGERGDGREKAGVDARIVGEDVVPRARLVLREVGVVRSQDLVIGDLGRCLASRDRDEPGGQMTLPHHDMRDLVLGRPMVLRAELGALGLTEACEEVELQGTRRVEQLKNPRLYLSIWHVRSLLELSSNILECNGKSGRLPRAQYGTQGSPNARTKF